MRDPVAAGLELEPLESGSEEGGSGLSVCPRAADVRDAHLLPGAGCLIIYPSQSSDAAYDESLETLNNMGRVVDALSRRASGLAAIKAA